MRNLLLSIVLLGACGGCATARPVGGGYELRKDTASECRSHCQSIGMDLSAVVIISNSAGCVCSPAGAPVPAGPPAAAAGAAAIQMQRAAQQQASTPATPAVR
jgi:hypothetical protein